MAHAIVASAMPAATALTQPVYSGWVPKESDTDERVRAHVRKLIRTRFEGVPYRLAKKCGLDSSTIYKMLSRERGVGTDVLFALSKGLPMSADSLLGDPVDSRFYAEGSEYGPGGPRPGRRPRTAEEDESALSQRSPAAKRG
jgi:transcriptional regulator with XRE-family HTH domain